MKIGSRWLVEFNEVSPNHYKCKAVDRDGRSIECEGDDPLELASRVHVDTYLYDNMVLSKIIMGSLRGRSATDSLDQFLRGFRALDDTEAGWLAFLESLTILKETGVSLIPTETHAIAELHESLTIALPFLLTQPKQESEQGADGDAEEAV